MRIDVYHFFELDPEVLALFESLSKKMDLFIGNQEHTMALIDELQTKADATLAQVTKNTDLDTGIITVVTANAQTIKDLKTALDAAGTDPAKLKTLSDTMDQIAAKTTASGQTVADAIKANTPAV